MSHLVKIELEITDVLALEKACQRLGLTFVKNQKTFQWWGREPAPCESAIKVPGARYEIGVTKKDGKYELQCDYYDQAIGKSIGQKGGLFKQAYTIEKAKWEAIKKGYSVRELQTANGIQLRVEVK